MGHGANSKGELSLLSLTMKRTANAVLCGGRCLEGIAVRDAIAALYFS
jgi:hypothetical protein